MNKTSCDIILDLMPLVKDHVASEASKALVEEHLETCETCKDIYENFHQESLVMNDKKVIGNIKKRILTASIIIIVIASMLGLALSETMGMFYNILIMPAIGVLGYLVLEKKSYYVPMGLFIFSYIWLFIKYIGQGMAGEGIMPGIFTIPIYWAGIYAGLCGLGVLIGFLLKYAFGREKSYEN